MGTKIEEWPKYDSRPTIDLNARCSGKVTLFRGGHQLCYRVSNGRVIFDPSGSGRCDGGIDGAYEVPSIFIADGYSVVGAIVKKQRQAR